MTTCITHGATIAAAPSPWRSVLTRTVGRGMGALAIALSGMTSALAADPYPSRPVRIIVNTAPGGLTDIMARLSAQHMGERLKQSFIVENRAGGDGLIGIRAGKGAPADGYTLLATAGTITLQMAMRADPGYDLLKDFTGIGVMARAPLMLVVGAGQPDKTLNDLVTRARKNQGKLMFASGGVGNVPHLAAERFLRQAKLEMTHVPYKGAGAAASDVAGGRVDMILETYGGAAGRIKGGQVRVLAVGTPTRMAALPDVPTFAEQGFNFTAYTWLSLVAPAGTPKDIVNRLTEALHASMASDALKERFRAEGMEPMRMSADEFNQFLAAEIAAAQKLVADLGLKKE